MTHEHVHRWSCDHPGCPAVSDQVGYGLPAGWTYLPRTYRRNGVEHRCPEHRHPEGRRSPV